MNTLKNLRSLFSCGKSKRRRTKGKKTKRKRGSIRRYKMRGG